VTFTPVSSIPSLTGPISVTQGTSPWVVGDGGGSLTVDGPLTDAQLRATPVPISDGGGSITIDGAVGLTSSDATVGIARVATSTASAVLRAANASRKMLVVVNDSSSVLYVKFGATASATSYDYRLEPFGTVEITTELAIYRGTVDGILDTGTGNAQVTELT
jgi:hypothetical protein